MTPTAATGRGRWRSLIKGKGEQCPICGADHACRICSDGIGVMCFHVREGCAKRRDTGEDYVLSKGMGWLHFLDAKQHKGRKRPDARRIINGKPPVPKMKPGEITAKLKELKSALTSRRLAAACEALGVSEMALRELCIGYSDYYACYSFPMRDGARRPVGIRLRSMDGERKMCWPGSTNGLFIPVLYEPFKGLPGLGDDPRPSWLALPEGPTSTAAAIDLGFRAVGRPSATGGDEYLRQLLRTGPRQEIVIIADNEGVRWRGVKKDQPFWPGLEGAIGCGESIFDVCEWMKIIKPPNKQKDLRELLKCNGTADDVLVEFAAAERMNPAKMRQWREVIDKQWRPRMAKRAPAPPPVAATAHQTRAGTKLKIANGQVIGIGEA